MDFLNIDIIPFQISNVYNYICIYCICEDLMIGIEEAPDIPAIVEA